MKLHVPSSLRKHANDQAVIELDGASVREILESISAGYPQLAEATLNESGGLKPHLQLFVNGANTRGDEAAGVRLTPDDEVLLISPVAGG